MAFNVQRQGEYFVVSTPGPMIFENLEDGRREVASHFESDGAVFESPVWKEDKVPCKERKGYWNRLQFSQKGKYAGREMGIFGSTNGLKENFCGPREIGEVIMNEAAIRQGAYSGGNPRYIEGAKAKITNQGNIVIAFFLPNEISPSIGLEELIGQENISINQKIRELLSC